MKIIYKDGHVDECPQDQELHVIRHTAAHIMAQAIKRLYPEADFAFGPATENGFYYDVDLGDTKLTDDDLANIEKEMRKICKENLAIKPFILPRDEAVKLMEERQEHYKIEHMADLADETEFSFFQQGEYVDMCIGPHLTYTKALKAFKITQQSGAYWKNDKENKMLTRINGVAFHNQEELEAWEKEQQEARERDHRKIGKEMGLFMTDDLVGRGLPMFLPAGYTVWQELENYIKEKERARGYLHVMTPCIGTVNLYKTSGHWDHYRENMFPAMEMEGESYVLRPMNCPHHMMIYANQPHSYRQLPIRIGEIAHDFRYESSGTLKGIERGRHFCQNDAHLFCTPEQIKSEVANVCALIFDVYKDFNITDYRCVLSLRDPADKKKYHDDDAMWNHAENALREVLIQRLIAYKQFKGAAAALGARMQAESRMHPRVAGPDPEFLGLMPDYLAGITLRGLAVICADLDGKRQTFLLEAEHVAPHRVPLDLTVASVDRFTMAHQTCTFRELLDGDATTEQLVVTFLAMLELAKRGSLTLSQDEIFGTIQINRVEGAEAYVPGEGPELTE